MESDEVGRGVSAQLRRHGLTPRKQLGQNFLRDSSILSRLTDAAGVTGDDHVLEIGAGTGVLTRSLLALARSVVAIELDDGLASLLRVEFSSNGHFQLWHGNALDFEPQQYFPGRYKLLGNIPYYITGPLVRRYLELDHPPSVLVFMVQREVAERIVAPPGQLSVLGVSVQYYADAAIVARVPASAFYPVPKVDSAILRLVPRSDRREDERGAFFHAVKAGFTMPRKQIANSLAAGLNVPRPQAQRWLHDASIEGARRAETLSVQEWIALSQAIPSHEAIVS